MLNERLFRGESSNEEQDECSMVFYMLEECPCAADSAGCI